MFFPGSNSDPLARLQLGFAGAGGCTTPHLSVDGMTEAGPNLSHWPGNRTPPEWKADLSTGIALRFANAAPERQDEFLGDAQLVVNDHYDTDGFGALLAVLRPDVARKHEELLLAAAATGDFGVMTTWRGFAIDRIVRELVGERSPVRGAFTEFAGEGPDRLALERYRWLLEHCDSVLGRIGGYRDIYEQELRLVQQQIDGGLRGAFDVRHLPASALSVVTSDGELHRMTLNTLARAWRVLHVMRSPDGVRYRYHDRTESWFELVTLQPPPRRDLRELAKALEELEPERDGASWNADPPTTPIPELYFGVPSEQEYGAITRELRPSALAPERVAEAFASFLATGDSRPR